MHAKQIARGGIFVGVSVVLLYFATFLSIASWAACMLVGFLPEFFFLIGERRTGTMIYVATSALSMFLLPDKSLAILYVGLFGGYTVLRYYVHLFSSVLIRWGIKIVFCNLWVFVVIQLIRFGFFPDFSSTSPVFFAIVFVIGNLLFVYYDFCLSRIFPNLTRLAQKLNR